MKLKQFLSCITTILLVTGIFPLQVFAASDAAMTGDGSPANPYIVMALEQLDAVRNNLTSHYKLGADIDASETAGWNDGEGFEPIGGNGNAASTFTGTFDGAGHVIRNLTVNRPTTDFVGLFGIVGSGGIIRDVGLVEGSITGNSAAGGLVGYGVTGSSISSSYSSVFVNGSVYVGGLAGRQDGAVSDSYATGSASGTSAVGGLVGNLEGAEVIRSYASGEVNASGGHAGGLAGIIAGSTIIQSYAIGAVSGIDTAGGLVGMTDYGLIRQSYASGAVKGSGYAGGLVGSNNGALIEDSFWDWEAAGQSVACGNNTDGYGVTCPSMGLATEQALVPGSYSGWDFTNVWFMVEGSTRPFLRSEWSQTVANTHQLQLMAMNPGANYTLARDIDFETVFTDSSRSDMWATRHGEGSGFAPVGSMSNPYVAEFDGSNHLIENMVINRPSTDFVGLFGNLGSGGVVRNVGLEGGFVSGRSSTGALVGESYGGTIAQSYSSIDVSGTNNVGGVVGQNNIGGIVSQSFATGSIAGRFAVGGLIGRNERGTINDAYSTGFVNGISEVGGLAGRNVGSINRAYSVGKVTAAEGSVGGLVGRNFEPVISGRYNSQTSGHGDADKGTPRTTAEMKQRATFEPDWDFVHIWTIEEGKVYPALRNIIGNIGRDIAPPAVVSAVMDVEQPDRILLHFDEEVRLTDADGVMIESDGVGTAIIDVEGESTKTLAFTVSDAFEQGAEVIFSYDALLGNIVDLAGNPMSSLAGQIVYKLPVIGIMMKKADASDYEDGGWTNQSVTVIAIVGAGADDMVEFFYSLNGGLEQAYTNGSPIVITEEGTNSLTFQVTDRAGHTVSVELEVKIDKSPPSVVYEPSGSETQAVSASPTVTADDAASGVNASTLQYVWTTDTSTPSSGWTPFVSGTGLAKSGVDGDWYLHIRVSDAAGNESVRVSDRFRLISRTGSEGGNSGASGYPLPKGTYLVGMNGETITFDGGQIIFPAGAIGRTILVKITEVADPNTLPLSDGQRLVSRVFEVTKDQAGEFDKDVGIHFQFDVGSVRDEGTEVLLCWLNEETGQWMPLDNRKVDWEKGIAGGTTNHFTKFAVIAVTEEKAESGVRFTDIQGHWAEKSIVKLAEKGALHGYTDGSFMPDLEITRAEFAVILVQALDYTDKEGKTFNDMANHWAKQAVSTAHAYGVVHGYNDNTFAPDDPITREQMTMMIMNALQLETIPSVRTFADQNKISKWAREAVAAAAESGLITGYPDNTIRPQAHATRAEAASIIGRLL
ncbi:hypothetical protein B1748_10640 [Paenibacillus sp. MY03]|uniref:S-layer homology domain-containing protein n=1 Tax=Paenibacillus sp. MY03 TaxID=302980 RepID=UPI000B3D2CB3|nr:S-layer homology domain-containing protein [Paenibacillus sp. MY03]OUS76552.1 hypothetical protein B1748_10640 [Paenibacillus sp. MY03]